MLLPADPRVPQGSTYNRQAIIEAATRFYDVLSSMAENSAEDLQRPPPDGWPHITRELIMGEYGKTEEVYLLLKHLPYLRQDIKNYGWDGNVYIIKPWTELCDYSEAGWSEMYKDHINPDTRFWTLNGKQLPAWTVPLTRQTEGKFGTCYVVDTTDGTVTKMGYPTDWSDEDRKSDYAQDDPRAWRNLCQMAETIPEITQPAVDFFAQYTSRFHNLDSILVKSAFCQLSYTIEPRFAEDPSEIAHQALRDLYIKHGWPSSFDRAGCAAALPAWYERYRTEFPGPHN